MKAAATVAGVVLSAALVGMAGMAGAADEGTVYKWVDKDGTPHYQDRPPEGAEGSKELNMRYKLTDNQAVAAANKHKTELSDAAQTREKQQTEDKAADQQDKDKVLNEREQGCKQAQDRLAKYSASETMRTFAQAAKNASAVPWCSGSLAAQGRTPQSTAADVSDNHCMTNEVPPRSEKNVAQ